MISKQQYLFGVEEGEILILAKDTRFCAYNGIVIYEINAGDVFVCVSVVIRKGFEQYAHADCIVLHPSAGLLSLQFQYRLNETAWKGTFVGK